LLVNLSVAIDYTPLVVKGVAATAVIKNIYNWFTILHRKPVMFS
jgi:hypothetical protein